MVAAPTAANRGARAVGVEDIERVVAIDRAHTGRSRRRFFETRFAAAKASPDDFVHIGVMRGGSLRGFAIARILRGEFGRERAVAVLDAVGVELECQERGIGQALMQELADIMQRKQVGSIHSQVDWRNHELLRFFHSSGFELAGRVALERSVAQPLSEASDEV